MAKKEIYKEAFINGAWRRFTLFISDSDFEKFNKNKVMVFIGTGTKTRIDGQVQNEYEETKYFFFNMNELSINRDMIDIKAIVDIKIKNPFEKNTHPCHGMDPNEVFGGKKYKKFK